MRRGLYVSLPHPPSWMPVLALLLALSACAAPPASPSFLSSPAALSPIAMTPETRTPGNPTPAVLTAGSSTLEIPTLAAPTPGATEDRRKTPVNPPTPRARYTLEAELDYAAHRLSVTEQIEYPNTTPETLTALPLMIEALRYPGAFRLGAIYGPDGQRLTSYRLKDTTLTLNLPAPLLPGETFRFSLDYTLQLLDTSKLPQLRPYPLGYTSLQANFGDWYPFVPPYSPEKGWLAHPPATYGEHLAYDLTDFDVTVRFAGGQGNLVVAAPAAAESQDQALRFRQPAARNFAWSVSPYYQVLTQTVQLGPDHRVLVASTFFPLHREAGESLLEALVQSLSLYTELFGAPYPHPRFTAVQADFMDGMEYDGLFFLSTDFYNWHKDQPQDFLIALAAHETAHQWFGGLVGNDPALEPWLDEALCTYAEVLFYENLYPQALEWWWAYRVDYYTPRGAVNLRIYDAPNVAGQYRLYRDPVYLRGAQFIAALRARIGEQAFFAALRDYVQRQTYRQARAEDFFDSVRRHSDQDLAPLLDEFFAPPER